MKDFGKAPRMLSDPALTMFQTPEALQEQGLRQVIRKEVESLTGTPMPSFQDGGIYLGQTFRTPVAWPWEGTPAPVHQPAPAPPPAGSGLSGILSQPWRGNDPNKDVGPTAPVPDPEAEYKQIIAAMGGGSTPTIAAPKLEAVAAPTWQAPAPVDILARGDAYAQSRQGEIDAALSPMQQQADLANAQVRELDRDQKWKALTALGISLMEAGGPSKDPRSANFLSAAAQGVKSYVGSLTADKDKINALKKEAAQVAAQMAYAKFGASNDMRKFGAEVAGQEAGIAAQMTAAQNQFGANVYGTQQQAANSRYQADTQRGIAQAHIVAGIQEANIRAAATVQAAMSRSKAGAAFDLKDASDVVYKANQAANDAVGRLGDMADPTAQFSRWRTTFIQSLSTSLQLTGIDQQQALAMAREAFDVQRQTETADMTGNQNNGITYGYGLASETGGEDEFDPRTGLN